MDTQRQDVSQDMADLTHALSNLDLDGVDRGGWNRNMAYFSARAAEDVNPIPDGDDTMAPQPDLSEVGSYRAGTPAPLPLVHEAFRIMTRLIRNAQQNRLHGFATVAVLPMLPGWKEQLEAQAEYIRFRARRLKEPYEPPKPLGRPSTQASHRPVAIKRHVDFVDSTYVKAGGQVGQKANMPMHMSKRPAPNPTIIPGESESQAKRRKRDDREAAEQLLTTQQLADHLAPKTTDEDDE
jgi:hypothetical protein